MAKQIKNKQESFDLYFRGCFGNRLKSWESYNNFISSAYSGFVTIRSKMGGGGFCAYNVNAKDVDSVIGDIDKTQLVFNESAPDDMLLIQGEVCRDICGLSMFYSIEPGKMRDCLKRGTQINGIVVNEFLKYFLLPNSLDDIFALLDIYDGVVEFSAYDTIIGDCPNRNTIIWEIRNY